MLDRFDADHYRLRLEIVTRHERFMRHREWARSAVIEQQQEEFEALDRRLDELLASAMYWATVAHADVVVDRLLGEAIATDTLDALLGAPPPR